MFSAVVAMPQLMIGCDVFSGRSRALGASVVMIFRNWLRRLRARRGSAEREVAELERVPAVTYVQEVGHNDTAVYVSPQVEALTGYSTKDFEENPDLWYGAIHPEDIGRVIAEDERTDDTGERFSMEYRMVRRDGGVVWVRNEAVLAEDQEGRPRLWQGVMIDVTERKRIEAALYESEQRFRGAFENASTGVALIGMDRRYFKVNRALCGMLGYPEEELLLKTSPEITHPDDREVGRERSESLLAGEIESDIREKRYVRKDGETVWVLTSVSVVHDPEGNPSHFVSQFQDITQRKRVEEALKESEERFRALVQNASDMVVVTEADGTVRYVSPAVEKVLGRKPEELSGKDTFAIMHPEDVPRARQFLTDVVKRPGVTSSVELRLRHADGSWRHVESRCTNLLEDPAVRGVVINSRDVTRRKEAETRLREAEARYRTLVEQIPAGVYIQEVEHEGAIAYISPRIEDILGYSPNEYVEDPGLWKETTYPEDREKVLAEDALTDETGEPFRMEFRKITRDGRVIWIRDEAILVRDAEGNPLHWQGIFFDITERKQAEEKLRESKRRLSALLSNAPAYLYRCRNEQGWPNEFVSDYAFELTNYTPEELTDGRVMFGDLIVEEDRVRIWDEVQAALAGRKSFELQYSIRRKDGGVRHVEERGQGLFSEDGEVEAIEGVVYDVTERVRAEEALREAEERYRTLVEQIPAVTYIDRADDSFESVYTSPQIEEMLGYSQEEWRANRLWEKRLHPADRERVLAADDRLEIRGEAFSEEYRLLAKNGSVVWVREEAVLIRDEQGEPLYWQGVIFDMTERKEAEEELRKSQANLAEAQRMAHLGSWEWDLRTGEVDWSDETFRVYGFEPQSFAPSFERLLEVVHLEDRKVLRQAVEDALHQHRPYDFEHRIVKPDGEVRLVHRRAEVVRGEGGEPIRMVGTVHDVTERKALEELLQHQALHDPLTGLPNRTLFADRLRQALARSRRRKVEVSVLFMDLDNFKVINDSLGHKAGERLLVVVSKRMRSLLRPEDTVARLGGDEFIFLLEDTGTQDAVRVAERILEQMREPFFLGRRRLFVTASIGVATGGVNGKYEADLLRNADLAMYRAKHSGKARYAVFEEAMNTMALERLEMEHGLRRALERDQLRIHYQPQMLLDADLQGAPPSKGSRAIDSPGEPRIIGMEALVRWEHPERGLLLPGEFVPLAEETGLIVPIGEVVLEEACRQTREWQERFASDPLLSVYVNLSARQFREPDLTETVSRVLKETGLDPTCLHLEITESTAMSDAPATVSTLEELTALGVRLVIDDFGTGYSSLSYLERFPVDYVKIDRSFVGGLETESGATALVSGMISLAHALGIKVIAEGVERAGQLERVHALGCDLAQGRYFSAPLPGEEIGELLESNTFR
ncbi:MAG TPA: PAS domain-containing protein [Rubrobacter sp.]|nr:PAS domain-containing protein [Rubrobacter sp.]